MLRIHLMQNRWSLTDGAMEDALIDTGAVRRRFAGIDLAQDHSPDTTTILACRYFIERHQDEKRERDPQMGQTCKGNQWFFGMKGQIRVDRDSGLIHSVATTAAHVRMGWWQQSYCMEKRRWWMGMPVTRALRSERRWQDERWTVVSPWEQGSTEGVRCLLMAKGEG